MDYNTTGVICTKRRLWKQQSTVVAIISHLQDQGYHFKEVVLGEPNNFIFADTVHELDEIFAKKGYYGIRIKMDNDDTLIEINSNTDGINNVQYTIFAESEELLVRAKQHMEELVFIIRPSNNTFAQFSEWLGTHKQIRNIAVLVLIAITLYFLGVHVFIFSFLQMILSFSPFLTIYIIYLLLRRRR
ncbi:hypothetical protein [Candidatus Xianfuyuplasma coldseepsis]|uniref:Uncharacterized protein n=1 Tax=Candidatus Xianfuyuplasma coldseepsis TaxID=2782163 RepID=A0A7L7KPZ4_9MOLU|nr:hypothetical protein [Xianfuyuplasma coldseepsis]QMS84860.1 hypothetical protein G4Z02_03525 [Xianfuyuplasma coldseepsis]